MHRVSETRKEEAEDLASRTTLSSREAQLYILHVWEDMSLSESAEEMGTSDESQRWHRVKRKIREADETAELDIP